MIIENFIVGPLETNCFIIAEENTREALVVDPGDESGRILDIIKEKEYKVNYIVCTHAHFDHVGAIPAIKNETGAKVVLHKNELEVYKQSGQFASLWGYEIETLPSPDLLVSEGDILTIGDLAFKVLHTPGHSPGGICLFGEGIIITGDTLFAGSVGRTDFEGGDIEKLKMSFKRLMALPGDLKVLPGHGPQSTINSERYSNFFNELL